MWVAELGGHVELEVTGVLHRGITEADAWHASLLKHLHSRHLVLRGQRQRVACVSLHCEPPSSPAEWLAGRLVASEWQAPTPPSMGKGEELVGAGRCCIV